MNNNNNEIITLEECKDFFRETLESDDYEILSALCEFPSSTIKKYIKEGSPNTAAGNILSKRIVVHSIEIIRLKANSQINKLNNLIGNYILPDITA